MGSGGNIPKFPSASKEYEKGIKVYMKYLPLQLQKELEFRAQYDPQFIEQALGIQHKYDPQLAGEQLDALQRRDPEWLAMHKGLGAKISEALDRGYLDPRQEAAYQQYSQLMTGGGKFGGAGAGSGWGGTDQARNEAYQALGKQVTGDTLRGTTASPSQLRDMTQAILARSPTLSYGEAQNMAAAVYTGQRGQALQQQRQQATGQFLQTTTPEQQAQQGLAQFYGMAPPEAQALAQAGSYLSSPTQSQMINQIQGVTPPSAFRYEDPNAGRYGQQWALQNYQNQLAYNQMGGGQSSNPWMGALQGAGQGASYGSVGGPYGAAGGAIVGAVAGGFGYPQFSDSRGKKNISRTGTETRDGIPIVEYEFDGKRWRGVIAQDVEKVKPEAVYHYGDGRLGVFYSRIGLELEEIK